MPGGVINLTSRRAIWGLAMAVYYLNRKGELVLSLFAEEPRVRRRDRPRCGARTRKGRPCRAPAVWDRGKDQARNGRCRLHGGLSTGPPIDRRVNLGWLAGVARNDKAAVLAAFQRFVQQALGFSSSGGSE